jgi:hypothetical protein
MVEAVAAAAVDATIVEAAAEAKVAKAVAKVVQAAVGERASGGQSHQPFQPPRSTTAGSVKTQTPPKISSSHTTSSSALATAEA